MNPVITHSPSITTTSNKADDPPVRSRRRKEARPHELIEAAFDLMVERGYAATRVEAVARRAGVSKGTLFRYFSSKEALFQAVVQHQLSGLIEQWHQAVDEFQGSSAELLRHGLLQWWQQIGATRRSGILKLVLTEAAAFPELAHIYQQDVMARSHALLRRMLQRGIDRGEFQPIDLEHGIHALTAPMMFLVLWKHSMGPCTAGRVDLDPERFVQTQVDLLLQGLLTRPALGPCVSREWVSIDR